MNEDMIRAIQDLVQSLVDQRYSDIVADGRGGRVTEDEMRTAISDYGRTLIPLPDEAWSQVDVYEQANDPGEVMVDVPLWTVEEGRSDLTLSISARKEGDQYHLEIDDLHVL
jgi:hypothetical protein